MAVDLMTRTSFFAVLNKLELEHTLVGMFASHDDVLSLWWSDLLQRLVWQ